MANIESELNCNICLDLLNDPHHYPCGHSFCLRCINALRNSEIYACPDCRRHCPDRTDIVKDFRLTNILEAYRQSGNAKPTKNICQPSAVWLGRQEPGILLVILLLMFISAYAMFRLQRTEQALQDFQVLTDSTHPVTSCSAKLEGTEHCFQDSQILMDSSQPEQVDKVAASPGPLHLLLAPLRWLWLLVEEHDGLLDCWTDGLSLMNLFIDH
ncbi:hypothetical protein AALO_G00265510 [Alosa alosa]|uniref:RING-type domain-containing protein n=1 Tax=Alosa alosa TaxID=278164 RepID=A0AAV6FLR6_9TELE|nr:hypothetical protein AALO_G00265510 [Alosa alosa]